MKWAKREQEDEVDGAPLLAVSVFDWLKAPSASPKAKAAGKGKSQITVDDLRRVQRAMAKGLSAYVTEYLLSRSKQKFGLRIVAYKEHRYHPKNWSRQDLLKALDSKSSGGVNELLAQLASKASIKTSKAAASKLEKAVLGLLEEVFLEPHAELLTPCPGTAIAPCKKGNLAVAARFQHKWLGKSGKAFSGRCTACDIVSKQDSNLRAQHKKRGKTSPTVGIAETVAVLAGDEQTLAMIEALEVAPNEETVAAGLSPDKHQGEEAAEAVTASDVVLPEHPEPVVFQPPQMGKMAGKMGASHSLPSEPLHKKMMDWLKPRTTAEPTGQRVTLYGRDVTAPRTPAERYAKFAAQLAPQPMSLDMDISPPASGIERIAKALKGRPAPPNPPMGSLGYTFERMLRGPHGSITKD